MYSKDQQTLGANPKKVEVKLSEKTLHSLKIKYGLKAHNRITKWREELSSSQNLNNLDILYNINNFFNSIPYQTDIEHWGKSDYWATPIEMLGTNGGDCEDYVIAKYFSLRQLGIPDSKLRMMFVTALSVNQAHMVLAYYPEPNAIPLILDNINPRILPANKRRDLRPVYSFNGEGLWLAKAQGRGSQLGNSKHKLWDDLTARIERDF
ncbi:transglutaminase-like cysteine peptidase [Alteromonas macleodii]|uniref:transglutaminase-like cysteine peptidase n=1 Tax=Alteromonas macleodii TaxID=28108 RepID=UPI00193097F0|nr:transglutaminase-like cysteine peptidase [Alteromonas macleodii]